MKRQVTTFVIIPPREMAIQVGAAKERIEARLSQEFVGYNFKMTEYMPLGDEDDFNVLPVMNVVNGDGKNAMCEKPEPEFIESIICACWAFEYSPQKMRLQ